MKWNGFLTKLWSTTDFGTQELTTYAKNLMVEETRRGVMTMSFVSLGILLATAALYQVLGFGNFYVYTNALLATLSLHIFLSARIVRDIRVLHLLGMTLLTISGVAFVLLAHRTGSFSAVLLGSVVLLFMVVPMVPWGLKEALTVVALIYAVFTFSTWGDMPFSDERIRWTLQFVMLGAALVTLVLVARGVVVRRDDIEARFELEGAHREMELLSLQDPLTGVWNRRYLQNRFPHFVAQSRETGEPFWFVLCDLNNFKQINDVFGHDYGDKVLGWLATAFKTQVGDEGVAARMGGDEFALLFAIHSPYELLHRSIESVQALVRQDRSAQSPEISISAGVIAVPPDSTLSLDEAYKEADVGLYAAKNGKHDSSESIHLAGHVSKEQEPGIGKWATTF